MFLTSSIAERRLEHNTTFNPNINRHLVKSFIIKRKNFLLKKCVQAGPKLAYPLYVNTFHAEDGLMKSVSQLFYRNICCLYYKLKRGLNYKPLFKDVGFLNLGFGCWLNVKYLKVSK